MDRILVAYSGGLETSVAMPWLAETHHAEVITLTMDLGQGGELADVRARALACGAVRAHVIDVREEFARDYVLPALQANALYEGRYPLATALGRPLIARHLVHVAHLEGVSIVAHGGTEHGNDHFRLDAGVRAIDPAITVLALSQLRPRTRADVVAEARERGFPVPPSAEEPYLIDTNLWGRSIEFGILGDPWQEPPEEIYVLSKSPAEAPDAAAYVEIAFTRGVPVAINGVEMPVVDLIQSLETIAGTHGVGRIDMVESGLAVKSREIYEAPAAVALHLAHRDLQQLVSPRDLERLTSELAATYADLVYNGAWFSPTREAIDALVGKVQERVTGTVRLKLYKGDCRVVGRQSPHALVDGPPEPAASNAGGRVQRLPTERGGGRRSRRTRRAY